MLERCLCNVFAIFDVMLHLLFKHYMYKFVYTLSLVEQTQDRYLYVGKSGINYVNCAYFNVDLSHYSVDRTITLITLAYVRYAER